VKTIQNAAGDTFMLGRTRAVSHGPRLKLANYLKASVPQAPASCDYTAKAPSTLRQQYLNNKLGCCVISCGYHLLGVEDGNAEAPEFIASAAEIKADYGEIGGYVDGDPSTDNGCNEETALNFWQNRGFADGSKLLGWLAVDASNPEEVKQAIYLFENVVFGVELPDAWVNPFPDGPGFVWDVAGAADPENGHCFGGFGYADQGIAISTWGILGWLTWSALKYAERGASGGELYCALSPNQLAKGAMKAPNGVAWTNLIADFDSMGGHVPVPQPDPTPVPVPSGVPTLIEAQAWATSGIARGTGLQTRSHAEALARAGLAMRWPK
jgi:hypothetical protein